MPSYYFNKCNERDLKKVSSLCKKLGLVDAPIIVEGEQTWVGNGDSSSNNHIFLINYLCE